MNNVIQLHNAVTQTNKASHLKDTYGFISTADILKTFQSQGWNLTSQQVASVRKAEKNGYQRHMLRFSNPNYKITGLNSDNVSIPELVLVNSHDGSGAFRLLLGVFRIACANGMIAGNSFKELRVVHSGNLTKKLASGIDYISESMPEFIAQINSLQKTELTPEQQSEFIRLVFNERLKKVNPVNVNYSLDTKRVEDMGSDAYTLLNKVQEVVMRGGINYSRVVNVTDKSGIVIGQEIKRTTTKKISSIAQSVSLNRACFDAMKQVLAG